MQVEMKMNHMAEVGLMKMLIFQSLPVPAGAKTISWELGMIGDQVLAKLVVRGTDSLKFST